MFEKFDMANYITDPSQHDKDEIDYCVSHMDNHNLITKDFVDTARLIAVSEYRLARLTERMKFIDSQPKVIIVRMNRQRHTSSITVGVYEANKGFEGGPFYDGTGNLVLREGELIHNFTGKEKAKAYDCAIAMVKANPGSAFIVSGELCINDIPKRAQPFSRYTFEKPQKKVK